MRNTSQLFPQCQNLQEQVESLLQLFHQEPLLRAPKGATHVTQDTTSVQSSLSKAISPTFEIVFAGAFSAGKSMLINALLERELLYSAEGHATGTESQFRDTTRVYKTSGLLGFYGSQIQLRSCTRTESLLVKGLQQAWEV